MIRVLAASAAYQDERQMLCSLFSGSHGLGFGTHGQARQSRRQGPGRAEHPARDSGA